MLDSLSHQSDEFSIDDSFNKEFRSSRAGLFLPTLIIAIGYGALWLILLWHGLSYGALARLCMFVLLVGLPVLVAYSLLRYITTSIRLYEVSAHVHAGFPRRDPVNIPYRFMEYVEVHYGFLGRLTKSATLRIGLIANKSIEVSYVHEPERAKLAIELEIAKSAKKLLLAESETG